MNEELLSKNIEPPAFNLDSQPMTGGLIGSSTLNVPGSMFWFRVFTLLIVCFNTAAAAPREFTVATYNIYYRNATRSARVSLMTAASLGRSVLR